jgi:carbonic anhydrase/acetyltransferase-like protein (isoleucine patch superfamily)
MAIRDYNGKQPRIAQTAFVDGSAIVVGDVTVGEHSSLWPTVVARGDVQAIVVGDYTNVQDGAILHVTHDGEYSPGGCACRIGNRVTVGHRALLHGCTIQDLCLIGMAAIVMDGAVLEPRVLLAAGSLVPARQTLEGGYLWLGSPAQKKRPLTEKELSFLEYSAQHYARLKDSHRKL